MAALTTENISGAGVSKTNISMACDKGKGALLNRNSLESLQPPFDYKWCSGHSQPLVRIHSAEIAQKKQMQLSFSSVKQKAQAVSVWN